MCMVMSYLKGADRCIFMHIHLQMQDDIYTNLQLGEYIYTNPNMRPLSSVMVSLPLINPLFCWETGQVRLGSILLGNWTGNPMVLYYKTGVELNSKKKFRMFVFIYHQCT